MTNKERALAVLNYASYDRLPIVHFGFWEETLEKWRAEGHLSEEEAFGWADGNRVDQLICAKLGFDFNWAYHYSGVTGLQPPFEERVVEERSDGMQVVQNVDGVLVLQRVGVRSIPAEVDHLLKDRASWEEHYLPRLQYSPARVDALAVAELQHEAGSDRALGIFCGSLIGKIRDWCGVVGLSYLAADDADLLDEMIETTAELCYRVTEQALATGIRFDFGHFWEDICFNGGPLVHPSLFDRKIGPHYARIVKLLHEHGITIVSLDCDGKIDKLIPTWLHAGVNTMFPIEVGTWHASIAPWREQYGTDIRGVGGMDKRVFTRDRDAIDEEIERLRRLVALGGYIPCPDHRIAPDAEWDNVRYYCDRMRVVFG